MSNPKLIHERHIPVRGQHCTHHRVKSHSHTVLALLKTQLCITFLDVENVFGSRIQANGSPFLKTECGTYCVRDNGSSVWCSDHMFQRESLSAYHEKKSDSVFIGKRAIQQPSPRETSPVSQVITVE